MGVVQHCVGRAEMTSLTDTTEFLAAPTPLDVEPVTRPWLKLPIVLMLIARPRSGKACLGRGVSNARADNPFESDLTGHWKCSGRPVNAPSQTATG